MSGRGFVKVGKGITLVILNEDMDDLIRTIKQTENLGILIDGVIETVKHKIERQEIGFLVMPSGILVASTLDNMPIGKGVKGAGGYNNIDHVDKQIKFWG